MTQRLPDDVPRASRPEIGAPRTIVSPAPATRIERASLFLHPGQVFAAPEPTEITTILGSCVSVCLFARAHRVGGMNHYLLPHAVAGPRFPARFGSVAIKRLVERMADFGCRVSELEAKVFGGAAVVRALAQTEARLGAQNVDVALDTLRALGIPVCASDVGGARGRKLVFHTDDGAAWVKAL